MFKTITFKLLFSNFLLMENYWKFSGKIHSKFSEIFRKNMTFSGQFFRLTTLDMPNLFSTIISNPAHVLHQLLPPVKTVSYSLRPRTHNRIIIIIIRIHGPKARRCPMQISSSVSIILCLAPIHSNCVGLVCTNP